MITDKQVEAQTPFGWAVLDKKGCTERVISRVHYQFAHMEPLIRSEPDPKELLAYLDREYKGRAPHRLVTLYTAPQPSAHGGVSVAALDEILSRPVAEGESVDFYLQPNCEVVIDGERLVDAELAMKHEVLRTILAAAQPSAPGVDVQALIEAVLPGGSSCDPQRVADDIRAWFSDRLAQPSADDAPRPIAFVPVHPVTGPLWADAYSADAGHESRALSYERMPLFAVPPADARDAGSNHGLDTDTHVFFYEQDFYVLSNFSAFRVTFKGTTFDTAEAAYHYQRFTSAEDRRGVLYTDSAHDSFRYAQAHKANQRPDWDAIKFDVMREILRAKADQHEYVRRKLLATGDRILVENSWRDDVWGWGPNRDGQNMLGKLWMEIRDELRAKADRAMGGES